MGAGAAGLIAAWVDTSSMLVVHCKQEKVCYTFLC